MTTDPAETVVLRAVDLLNKHGFNDGDPPDAVSDLLPPFNTRLHDELDATWRYHALPELIRYTLLPTIPHRIETRTVDSAHNRVILKSLDGVDIDRDAWARRKTDLVPLLEPYTAYLPAEGAHRWCRHREELLKAGVDPEAACLATLAGLPVEEILQAHAQGSLDPQGLRLLLALTA